MNIEAKALEFATEKHKDQLRKDGTTPYINHCLNVVQFLKDAGITDTDIIAAALLHDTIEDTNTTADELRKEFGDTITNIVLECSDDKSLSKKQRKDFQIKHVPFISDKAKQVKIADKIANMRDILLIPPVDWSTRGKRNYFEWSKKVVDGARNVNPILDDMFDVMYQMKIFIQ